METPATINPKKFDLIQHGMFFCQDFTENPNHANSNDLEYYTGARHAFEDVYEILMDKELGVEEAPEAAGLSLKTKLAITAAVVTVGVYVAPKLERKFQIRARVLGAVETVKSEARFLVGK